ncbi:transporter (CPA2 family) [Algoriphagus boseongensis]|uniref:Transporter (CPA2 family) n=1 Tax=Algoriphagus boseongensis TaxID=1442587 RepID=A0A4R6T982_9BACT|nr:cation:proton antiporter [Algoriphagus boseongensis]TDQ17538.1 transporter (CPA2 family) [Algoriphagus boseongensis]
MISLLGMLEFDLPITHQGMKFFLILLIILLAPMVLNRLRIPPLLGLIIAGAVIGPKGLELMERDSGILLSGTAGLLYIMFLAGLEIDLDEFRKNSRKSFIFGMYTFWIPMILGTGAGLFLFEFSMSSSILLASMFASHTLIAYPIISKLGVAKNRVVTVTVGGTLITDTLALLILAVIVGMAQGEVNLAFWVKMAVSLVVFAVLVLILLPKFGDWFLKKNEDKVTQYIFVLALVFLGALLAELAGMEGIIGAFLVGLALSPIIPRTSPLMNRIEFVGNAIFIPFFLISVGMLVDFRVFISDRETIFVATVMTIVATTAKYLAALAAQKSFGYSIAERRIIFGLSNAQAAATLAAVLVGYNTVLGTNELGEPIRLLSESVLNGTIVMILVTCTIATLEAQKGAQKLILSEAGLSESSTKEWPEKFLIPIRNEETAEELLSLSVFLKSSRKESSLYGLSILHPENQEQDAEVKAQKTLNKASIIASATDNFLIELLRYDSDVVHGIASVVHENKITDLILGLHIQQNLNDSFLGKMTNSLLEKVNATTYIYKPHQPFSSHKRHLVLIPPRAEEELGFPFWLKKIWNIAKNSGRRMIFYVNEDTKAFLLKILENNPIRADFRPFPSWDDPGNLNILLKPDDNLIMVLSRRGNPSYHPNMDLVPELVQTWLKDHSFVLVFPNPLDARTIQSHDFLHSNLAGPRSRFELIRAGISRLFPGK